ncbi:hypothetical protein DEJ28_15195 [Curtobacterium sp. MCPF17_002]|uniref:hypothetical protein n=1 Tax=Curtobacterium sp. MCPF17_002 TaxID=2175645 RepID=UPI0024E03A8A|nr:hypothetical protein [Curtobacterium sp. MCPF17_002]WIB76983.1 hypothetical protein DEJ28_15195 [Curtobacterium sp. MCPF17_002]
MLEELGLRADGALEDVVGAELPSPWDMLLPEHMQALQGLRHQLDQLLPPAQL